MHHIFSSFSFTQIHDYKEGTPSQKSYFAEFWDIGGNVNHATSRHIYYNPVNGKFTDEM